MTKERRIGLASIWHETLTFSDARTEFEDFLKFQVSEGVQVAESNFGVKNEMGGFLDTVPQLGMKAVPLFFAGALPSPTVSAAAYERLRTRFASLLSEALPLDGLLLGLHGAMVAENTPDVEGDLLSLSRGLVGEDCPIVATLDFHANISDIAFRQADVLVVYDTYPHVDIYERGCEAARILKSLLDGTRCARAFRKLPLLTVPQVQNTNSLPMREIMQRVKEIEEDSRILTMSVAAGYPYSDVDRLGVSVTAYTSGDQDLAERYADEIANLIWGLRDQFRPKLLSSCEAVRLAMAEESGLSILVDTADNIGGGTPGDGTELLRELLRQRPAAAVVTITDSESVALACEAGVGSRVRLRVGGKFDAYHGEPVEIDAYIRLLSDGKYTHYGSYMTGLRVSMGRAAVVSCGDVEIVLMEEKAMPFDAQQLRSVGIEPSCRRILVVKSAQAWKAAYGDLARRVFYVDTPGLCSSNLTLFPYRNIGRPMYPLNEDARL